jgi:Rrf2 family protein
MLTKTSLLAIRALLWLAQHGRDTSVPPRRVAEALGASPTYLAKVSRLLVRAGVLRAEKGVKGGVRLARLPDQITLLAIVEACQGALLADYCEAGCDVSRACAFHQAAEELHRAVTGILSRWTLAQLVERPRPAPGLGPSLKCVLAGPGEVAPRQGLIPPGISFVRPAESGREPRR